MLRDVPAGFASPPASQQVGETGAVERCCSDASDVSGAPIPTSSRTVGRMSMAWANWRRTPPSAGRSRRGHETMQGSATPPSCTSRFQRLKGVLPGHGPAPWIVVVAVGAADLVDALGTSRHADELEVREPAFVDRSLLPTLGAGPVVRHDDHDGVVGSPEFVDEVQDPPDLLVGVGEVGGETLHESLGQSPLAGVERLPARHPGRARRERGALGDDTDGELAGEGLVAPCVPALGEMTFVPLDPLGRRMVWGMAGTRGRSRGRRATRRRRRAGRPGTRWHGRPGRR